MKKTLLLILLFFILVVILSWGLMQTSYAQNELREWMKIRTGGALKIEKIKGFFPFWFKITGVELEHVKIEEATLILSPTSLLLGRLSILDFKTETLHFDGIKGISLQGRGEVSKTTSLHLTLTYADFLFTCEVEIDNEEKSLSLLGHLSHDKSLNIWVSGIYKNSTFTGEANGAAYTADVHSLLSYKEGLFTLEDKRYGRFIYNLATQHFEGRGAYNFYGDLNVQPEKSSFHLTSDYFQWNKLAFSNLNLSGNWRKRKLTFLLTLQELTILGPAQEVFPTTHLHISGEATHNKLLLEGDLIGLGEKPFTLSADIPFDPSRPLYINLQGNGVINPLLAFLENASLIAKGTIDMNLSISGSWNHPTLTGGLIYEGSIESLATGTLYRDIHMELIGEGPDLKIASLISHDFDRGDLSGVGTITWDLKNGFPFEFKIFTHRYTLLALDPLFAKVDAEFTLAGNIDAIFITGHATLIEGNLTIPDKIPQQVPTLEVTYLHPLVCQGIEEKKPLPVHWDVFLTIPRHLAIEGRGLTSEWRGDLHLLGPQEALTYSGRLKLVGGRFTIVGRTFTLTEGSIQIAGLEPKDIRVDLKGDLELATLTASLLMYGTLDATHIAFSSNPPMSTNQILSWILFNQDVNELTPFQACRLANVLVTLSGKYVGPGVFNRIKEGLGIDVFDITNCDLDSTDFTFQIGKYISQGTFVGVNKSLSGDFDSILIQMRLYRNFYLEGDYGGSLNSLTPSAGKMIFKWYKSY